MIPSGNTTMRGVTFDILNYQKEEGFLYEDLPFLCPSDDFFGSLLNQSSEIYSNVFNGSIYNKNGVEQQYRERLERMKYKFCEIDAMKMLLEDRWKQFFSRYSTDIA